MPPVFRRDSLPDALSAFAAQCDVILSWAADLADLDGPTRLPGWSVRELLAHLVMAAERLRDAAAVRTTPMPVADYVATYAGAAQQIAEQPRAVAGDPRERLAAACAGVLARAPWPATVVMWSDPLAAQDALATRVVELVVHGDDLGVMPDRGALGLTCRALAGIFAARHPGRAVELRVAPFAAVQVLEGTVHRRGNPTAVVAFEPLTWIRLATGRLTWLQAVETGTLQASGERSDLSAYLPLLS